jgi:hypothetical protein
VKRFINKKAAALGIAAAVILGGGGAAFAYFTTTGGTGHGTASTGTAGAVKVTVTNTTADALVPSALGDHDAIVKTITYKVTNLVDQDNFITKATISVTSSWHNGTTATACNAGDFSINGAAVGTAVTVALGNNLKPDTDATHGGGTSVTHTFTIQLVTNGKNQDKCESVNPTLKVVVS